MFEIDKKKRNGGRVARRFIISRPPRYHFTCYHLSLPIKFLLGMKFFSYLRYAYIYVFTNTPTFRASYSFHGQQTEKVLDIQHLCIKKNPNLRRGFSILNSLLRLRFFLVQCGLRTSHFCQRL